MSLVLDDVSHRYGAVVAVEKASLSVAGGEIVCLFGPSGCGKTTLLRIAAGFEPLQQGAVLLNGRRLAGGGADLPPEKREIGFVFQDYVLFPHLTALENVMFGLAHMVTSKRKAAAREELARVGLAGLERRRPHELSGGQQQRVALARAFVRRPQAMLLDEPFASIDAVLRRRLRADIRTMLKAQNAATLLVTHDPDEALALGDRIAIMKQGRIIEAASPAALFAAPQTIEGAMLFSQAQALHGESRGNGVVATPFGEVPLRAPLASGRARVVFLPGGAMAQPDLSGPAIAIDGWFAGPGHIVRLRTEAGADVLTASTAEPPAPGHRFRVSFDPMLVRAFPGRD